ncbi:MAG: hypothetical protein SWJ54_03665 [Cyanobacteriota bacterium]|nr:hypothetical protein [Cyanobacteriota bacterium]
MSLTLAQNNSDIKENNHSPKPIFPLKAETINSKNEDKFQKRKEKLTQEILAYQAQKKQELTWARRLNRGSIGMALVLTAATTICTTSNQEKIKDLATPLGTLALTLNGWIASVPMSKKVSLYERTLIKTDNLRSDLEFIAETEESIEEIRESFKSLKIEFIQDNPIEKYPSAIAKSPSKV